VVFRRTECGYASSKWVQLGAAVVAVGSAAASGLALFAAITAQPVDGVYALWMGGVCVLMARTALLKVEVRREGVQVVNLWRTDLVPWFDFAGFASKRWLAVYPQVVFVVRRSGRPIPVVLLMGGGFFIGGDDSRVDDGCSILRTESERSALRERFASGSSPRSSVGRDGGSEPNVRYRSPTGVAIGDGEPGVNEHRQSHTPPPIG